MIALLISFVGVLALVAVYIWFVRPYLEQWNIVKPFPDSTSVFFGRLRAHIRSSATMLVGWFCQLGGYAVELALLLDKDQVKETLTRIGLGEWFGVVAVVIGWLIIIARLRTARSIV